MLYSTHTKFLIATRFAGLVEEGTENPTGAVGISSNVSSSFPVYEDTWFRSAVPSPAFTVTPEGRLLAYTLRVENPGRSATGTTRRVAFYDRDRQPVFMGLVMQGDTSEWGDEQFNSTGPISTSSPATLGDWFEVNIEIDVVD